MYPTLVFSPNSYFCTFLCLLKHYVNWTEHWPNFFLQQANSDEDTEDNGSECVICMCDIRDTLILPCRHLCLCNSCADSLRYQANNCPICRAPFRALLQIRALQKATSQLPTIPQEVCQTVIEECCGSTIKLCIVITLRYCSPSPKSTPIYKRRSYFKRGLEIFNHL